MTAPVATEPQHSTASTPGTPHTSSKGLSEPSSSSSSTAPPAAPTPSTTAAANKKPASLVSALSGAMSGALISAMLQPLDVVRTRMQAEAAKGVFRGTVGTLKLVVSEGGPRSLWMGTGATVVRLSAGAALHFTLLEHMKSLLLTWQDEKDGHERLTSVNAALAGGLSRAVAAFALCPITVVKTRMEYGKGMQYKNTFHAVMTIAKTEGPRGLFRGLGPTMLTNAPFSGLYYMFYVRIKEAFSGNERPSTVVNFSYGVVAAVAASLLTQPTDVLRTRLQLGLTPAGGNATPWSTLGALIKQQGPGALLTGVVPRAMKRSMQTALIWTLYDELLPRLTAMWMMVKSESKEA